MTYAPVRLTYSIVHGARLTRSADGARWCLLPPQSLAPTAPRPGGWYTPETWRGDRRSWQAASVLTLEVATALLPVLATLAALEAQPRTGRPPGPAPAGEDAALVQRAARGYPTRGALAAAVGCCLSELSPSRLAARPLPARVREGLLRVAGAETVKGEGAGVY